MARRWTASSMQGPMCSSGTIISSLAGCQTQEPRKDVTRPTSSVSIEWPTCKVQASSRQYGSRISAISIGGGSMFANLLASPAGTEKTRKLQQAHKRRATGWSSRSRPSFAAGTLPEGKVRQLARSGACSGIEELGAAARNGNQCHASH